jgi:hypothetical protein
MIGRLVVSIPSPGLVPLEVKSFGRNEVLVLRRDQMGAAYLAVYPVLRVEPRR